MCNLTKQRTLPLMTTLLLSILLLLQTTPANTLSDATNDDIQVSSHTDKAKITIGDKFKYHIEVQYPEGAKINLPAVVGNLSQFEIKTYDEKVAVKTKNNLWIQKWDFELSTFTVGDYTIPPQPVEYTIQGDTIAHVTYSKPISIKVERTTPENIKDIASLRPIEKMSTPHPYWIYLLILLLATISLAIWLYLRKKRAAKLNKKRLPPYEEALTRLEKLLSEDLPAQGSSKRFCFELSEILRTYISRCFTIDALESTTEELLQKIKTLDLTAENKKQIAVFCEITDPVKFANQLLTKVQKDNAVSIVRTTLENTKALSYASANTTENTATEIKKTNTSAIKKAKNKQPSAKQKSKQEKVR